MTEKQRKARTPNALREQTCKDCGGRFAASRSDALRCPACKRKSRSQDSWRSQSRPCLDCGQPRARRAEHCLACAKARGIFQQVGTDNPFWKGGRIRHSEGYVYILNPARFDGDTRRYIAEHVYIIEQERGERLPKSWHVHHLNGIKDDNRRENLVAMSASEHHRNHHEPWEARIRQLEAQLSELRQE